MLGRLLLWQKFALLGVLGVALLGMPLTLYLYQSNEIVAASEAEARGAVPSQRLLKVVQLTQQHRGMAAGALNNDATLKSQRPAKQAEVDQAVRNADELFKRDIADTKLLAAWDEATRKWKALAAGVAAGSVSGKESTAGHTGLVSDYLLVLDQLADYYGLSLDPELASYNLVMASLYHMPATAEALGQLRARGTGVLSAQQISPAERAEIAALVASARYHFSNLERALGKSLEADALLRQKISQAAKDNLAQADSVMKLVTEEVVNRETPAYAPGQFFGTLTKAIDGLFSLNSVATDTLSEILEARAAKLKFSQRLTIALVFAIALFAVFIGRAITRSITRPLARAVNLANAVAAGDLTSEVNVTGRDETAQLMQALKTMNGNLLNLIGGVRRNAGTISSASQQIATGNADLSQRTEEQARSLEETASSMEELTSTVKQNAENAKQANQLAAGASAVAVKGGSVVSQVVQTMSSINASSKKIVDIIAVIDGIAFQTNILALNAAVEAARAGEQGRGFAVVATEVRNLAQRSAAAAKEIKSLIRDSVENVESGALLVDEAGKTMEEIVSSVKRVTDIMSEITAASQEQSGGIAQVNQAITQMDQATQQNAALVEEAATAAESMQEQAQSLAQAVSVFRLAPGAEAATKTVKPVAKATAFPASEKIVTGQQPTPAKLRKVAGGDTRVQEWEEF